MKTLPQLTQAFVSLAVIRDAKDLVLKPLSYLILICALSLLVDHAVSPPETRKTAIELFTIITIVTAPFLVLFLFATSYLWRQQAGLSKLAMTDVLTQLPNRRAFLKQAQAEIDGSATGWLLIIDADHFKSINDTHGHQAGDLCLRTIAMLLANIVSKRDVAGRLGGEEFGLFFKGVDSTYCDAVARILTRPIAIDLCEIGQSGTVSLTLSIGATEVTGLSPLEQLLRQADIALYVAKGEGRARMVRWEPGLKHVA